MYDSFAYDTALLHYFVNADKGRSTQSALTSVSAREPVPQPDASHANQNWDPRGGRIFFRENHLYETIVAAMNGVGDGPGNESRTDQDSHANMPVVGSGVLVIVEHNRTCEVSPYSLDYKPMKVPLVDMLQ
jgi:hypothetical protein